MASPLFSAPLTDTERREIGVTVIGRSKLSASYLGMNGLATIVASYGLMQNSPAVIIGAMLIASLLGPIMGLGLAMTYSSPSLLKTSFLSESIGIIWVFFIAYTIGNLQPEFNITPEMYARTAPNVMDLIIAVSGGLAGSYAIMDKKIDAAVVGVAIATALVPPLATCGLLFARGEYPLATGSFILFFTNVISIIVGAIVIFWFKGFRYENYETKTWIWPVRFSFFVIFTAMTIYLSQVFVNIADTQRFETRIKKIVRQEIQYLPHTYILDVKFFHQKKGRESQMLIYSPSSPTQKTINRIEARIFDELGIKMRLNWTYIHAYDVKLS